MTDTINRLQEVFDAAPIKQGVFVVSSYYFDAPDYFEGQPIFKHCETPNGAIYFMSSPDYEALLRQLRKQKK